MNQFFTQLKFATALSVVATMLFAFSGGGSPFGESKTISSNQPQGLKTGPALPVVAAVIKFSDNMDGANDTAALQARGYKTYYRGTGPQGLSPAWFTPSTTPPFPALNGPNNGYVASNFDAVTGINDIDNWLVLPELDIEVGDTLSFWCQSPASSTYADSIRVMYSDAGDSLPEATTWVELGRFKTNTQGFWERKLFAAPTASPTARFAIRYAVIDGGPSGTNSDYIGIDQIDVFAPDPPPCIISTTPVAVDGSTCGSGTVTLTATAGDPANSVVWLNAAGTSIVGKGSSFTTPVLTATTSYLVADADTFDGQLHLGPTNSISANGYPFNNSNNGLFFTNSQAFNLDSVTLYTNGAVSGVILLRDTSGGAILNSVPFAIANAGTHQVYLGLSILPGNYYLGIGQLNGAGRLYRSTSGAIYPYTIQDLVSITGTDFNDQARYYYAYDWVVTALCVGPTAPVTATYAYGSNVAIPFFENFENGLPCNWSRSEATGSDGWLAGTASSLSSTYWTISATNVSGIMASNDDACNCDMSADFLISPIFDFSTVNNSQSLTLTFEAYYDSIYNSQAYVKISLDSGATWTDIATLSPDTAWQLVTVDLTSYIGNPAVQLAFHHNDGGAWADGFAIDDVKLSTACAGENITVKIVTDIFGSQITWALTNVANGDTLTAGGPYNNVFPYNVNNATHIQTVCVDPSATFEFQINDSNGNGLFDGNNTGTYAVLGPCGQILMSGAGAFAYNGIAPAVYDSAVFTITPPVINLGADTTVCQAASITLKTNLAGVTWSTGDTTQNLTLTNNTVGTFTYYVSSPAGACFATDTITVTVLPYPTVGFTYNANLGTVTFTNSSVNAISYTWSFGDGNTSTAQNPTHTYTANGFYPVTLTATNGCGPKNTTQTITIVGVSVAEVEEIFLVVSPNPVNDKLNVKVNNLNTGIVRIELVNVLGQSLYSVSKLIQNGTLTETIDMSHFEKGIYLLQINSEQKKLLRKIVVE